MRARVMSKSLKQLSLLIWLMVTNGEAAQVIKKVELAKKILFWFHIIRFGQSKFWKF
jgi:hypothetical protein